MRRAVSIILLLVGLGAWVVLTVVLAPPHFGYRVTFFGVALAAGVFTYWWPRLGWLYTVGLIPVANMPARALALGAHEALVFVVLGCGLGWWANRLVTRKPSGLPGGLNVPSVLLVTCVVSVGVITALRYADCCVLRGEPFRNVWVNVTGQLDAATAVRMVILAMLREILVPVLVWVGYGVLREDAGVQEHGWRWALWVWGAGLAVVIVITLYQSQFDPSFCMLREVAWRESRRVSGGMSDPNALGLSMFLLLPTLAWTAWRVRGIEQMLYLALVVGCAYALMQSGSRSGLLGVVLGVAVFCGVAAWRRAQNMRAIRRVIITLAAGGAGLVLCGIAAFVVLVGEGEGVETPVTRRLQGFYERVRSGTSISLVDRREVQWKQAWEMWRDYPVTGVGLGAFPIEVPNRYRQAQREAPVDNAWNQYLQWLAELGFVGFGLWLWWIGSYVRAARAQVKRWRWEEWVAAATLLIFLLLCLFGAHLQAAEVACLAGVYAGMLLGGWETAGGESFEITKQDVATLACGVAIVVISQVHYATVLLSYDAQRERVALPTGFGFYHVEDWQGQFTYQWGQRYAGREITVPTQARVMVLRMAAFDPDISPARPKRVNVRVNGVLMDTLLITDNLWREYEVYVYNTPAGKAELSLECDRVWRPPHEVPPRSLGVALATEVKWQNELVREAQGLSEWFEDTMTTPPVRYRWTGKRAAMMATVGSNGMLKVRLRAPTRAPFYRDPVRVRLWFNNEQMSQLVLPRSADQWVEQVAVRNMVFAGQRGILSVEASRLSRVRIKGSVRPRYVGVAVAEITGEE